MQEQLTNPLNIVAKLSILDVRGGPSYALPISLMEIVHVALF